MKYMGSKNRISKHILPIILKNRKPEQWYVDPFAGGMNIIDEVNGNRIANDKNKYLISMWKGLQEDNDRPYTIDRELYSRARVEYNNGTNIEFDDFMIGWIGWMASYNGRFFDGGYSGHSVGNPNRDYISEQIRNTEKQIKHILDVVIIKIWIFRHTVLFIVIYLTKIQSSIPHRRIFAMMNFGSGVEINTKKDIQYLYQNTMPLQILNLYGKCS